MFCCWLNCRFVFLLSSSKGNLSLFWLTNKMFGWQKHNFNERRVCLNDRRSQVLHKRSIKVSAQKVGKSSHLLKCQVGEVRKNLDVAGTSNKNFARKGRDVLDEMVQRKVESTNLLVENSVRSMLFLFSSDWYGVIQNWIEFIGWESWKFQ